MRKFFIITLAAMMCLNAAATVNYQVIPLPTVQLDASGKTFTFVKGQPVAYPAGNEQMRRNALFAQEFLGLTPQMEAGKRQMPVVLTLGLQSDNPDAYKVTINKKGVTIQGASESGVFYGIQMLRKSIAQEQGDTLQLPYATITDTPRFQYRGTMLDCARRFYPITFVRKFIDILALHGINKFHWHITDDQGWRFEVKTMPQLAQRGCYRPHTIIGHNLGLSDPANAIYDDTPVTGYYTQEQMREIVAYAAERYITVIPEIDLPGHMMAALSVYPELGCTGGPYEVWCRWGVCRDVLCVGNPRTLDFLRQILGELCDVFPSHFIHIGGDESPRTRWEKCPKCQNKMKELGLTKAAQLQSYVNEEMEKFLASRGREMIGWDEILEGGLSEGATVMSWRGVEGGIEAARQHHRVIMSPSSHCYFDHGQLSDHMKSNVAVWSKLPMSRVYEMEPIPTELSQEERSFILGAQCNVWGEHIDSPDVVEFQLLPRLAAMSEVLWMQPERKNWEDFCARLTDYQKLYRKLGYKYCNTYE